MTLYEVRTIQKGVSVWDPDQEIAVGMYSEEEIVVKICACHSLEWAKKIRGFVERQIAEESGFSVNSFTPRAVIFKVEHKETEIETDPERDPDQE